jgi:hypothetical protein
MPIPRHAAWSTCTNVAPSKVESHQSKNRRAWGTGTGQMASASGATAINNTATTISFKRESANSRANTR